MITGTLVKFEPLKTGEVTVTISCDKSVNLHGVVDLLGKAVNIALPSLCEVQDSKVALLRNMRDQLERMLEFINFEVATVQNVTEVTFPVNAIAKDDSYISNVRQYHPAEVPCVG